MSAEHPRTFYRIRDWDTKFENNRTRELKYLEWVKFPNPMIDGAGDAFAELMNHPNGAAHFGFWCACVFLASRSQERGTLLRDLGVPHVPSSIALTCRIPAPLCEEAAGRLVSMGWLQELPFTKHELLKPAVIPHQPARKPHIPAGIPHEPAPRATRANGTVEENTSTPPTPPAGGRRLTKREQQTERFRQDQERRRQLEGKEHAQG